MARLTQQEIDQFNTEGWIGPYRLCSEAEIAGVLDEIRPFLNTPAGPPWAYVTMDAHVQNRRILEVGSHPEVVERIADLIGDDVLLWRAWTFTKRPGALATGVHRDGRIDQTWPVLDEPHAGTQVLAIWLAFEEASEENGCLWAFPGTQAIDYGAERVERYDPVDFSIFPSSSFLKEYRVDAFDLGNGKKIPGWLWPFVCAALRGIGLVQRLVFQAKRLLSKTMPNRFRSPPLTGLTRAEQRLFAKYVGPNVNLVTVEAIQQVPMKKVPMRCKPGEFYIFREDLIHTAPANTTDRSRAAVTFGYSTPAALHHPDRKPVLVHGTDGGKNVIWDPPKEAPAERAA